MAILAAQETKAPERQSDGDICHSRASGSQPPVLQYAAHCEKQRKGAIVMHVNSFSGKMWLLDGVFLRRRFLQVVGIGPLVK